MSGGTCTCVLHGRARLSRMSPTWIWLQGAIVIFVLIGMIIAITKLA
jgi:hypothetical protein